MSFDFSYLEIVLGLAGWGLHSWGYPFPYFGCHSQASGSSSCAWLQIRSLPPWYSIDLLKWYIEVNETLTSANLLIIKDTAQGTVKRYLGKPTYEIKMEDLPSPLQAKHNSECVQLSWSSDICPLCLYGDIIGKQKVLLILDSLWPLLQVMGQTSLEWGGSYNLV